MIYTGIGSRETPADVLALMTVIAARLHGRGFTLRSGAAPGADSAFEAATDRKEIYIPWPGFNGSNSKLLPTAEAFELAAKYHPAWHKCSRAARKLHARNGHQVLGYDLKTPTDFVLCWTKDALGQGGTGQALRIAKAHGIPIYDLADPAILAKWAIPGLPL